MVSPWAIIEGIMASQPVEQKVVVITYERYPRRYLTLKQAMIYTGFEETSRKAFLKWADEVSLSVIARPNSRPKYDMKEIDAAMEAAKIRIGGIGE